MLPTSLLCLTALAWLIPNHYLPWLSAWGDAVAILGLLLAASLWAASPSSKLAISWRWVVVTTTCLGVILIQAATGKILFGGDALLAAFYVCLWAIALLAGGAVASASTAAGRGLGWVLSAWCVAAVLSVGVALLQWTAVFNLGIYTVDLPPGGRPFGNVAQPNHLCTVLFIGLCALAWLYEQRRVSGASLALGGVFLLVGMVMTQSRTGWLQIGLLSLGWLALQRRVRPRLHPAAVLAAGALFALLVSQWAAISDTLLLSQVRSGAEYASAGTRLAHWTALVDAIGREPWVGHGWQQVGLAQQRVALDHPAVGEYIEHGHNLALDLMVWNGLPIAAFLIALLASWFVLRLRRCRDPGLALLLAIVAGLFVHGLLEYPLEYAYFLIPLGLTMGAVDQLSEEPPQLVMSQRPSLLALCTLAGLAGWIATDYLKAEENFRTLRLESARIGVSGITSLSPGLVLLTQLEAYLKFARTEATVGMTKEQIDGMRRVSQRYGDPPVMFRYALAEGLNGNPAAASATLARICKIHVAKRCQEARAGWERATLRQFPQLAAAPLPP